MKQPLLLLSGLLCDETIWADIPDRLKDEATVRALSFAGFASISAMADHVAMLNRPDALSVLSTIAVPTLLLSGSEDPWSPMSQHQTMRRRIPHATLFEIHGTGRAPRSRRGGSA